MRKSSLSSNKIRTFVSITSILLLINPSFADVYKWIDENGRVHYGDRPENTASQLVQIKKSNSTNPEELNRANQRQRLLEVINEEHEERKQTKEQADIARKKRKTNCDLANKNLNGILSSSYLYEKTQDPYNPRILSQEERNASTQDARNAVKKWCS